MKKAQRNNEKYCTFYIVRHGQTVWNVEGRFQGHEDSPLTALGEIQAKKVGEILKEVDFTEAYSSDLLRAKRTAEFITLEKNIAVKTTEILRERTYGSYEGKTRQELKMLLEEYEKLGMDEKFKQGFGVGVESDEMLSGRFITFLREVALAYPNKNILIVCHGGIMRSLLIHLGFGNYDTMRHYAIKNGAIIKLESDGVDFFVAETINIDTTK